MTPYLAPFAHPSGAAAPPVPADLVPNHVAIVMDGNGRWANERGLPRTAGHEAGEAALLARLAPEGLEAQEGGGGGLARGRGDLHRRRRARLSPQQHTQHATVLGRRQQRWIVARYAHKRLHHTRRMPLRERVMQRHQARRPRAHRPPASSQHARRPTASTPPAAPLNASVYL